MQPTIERKSPGVLIFNTRTGEAVFSYSIPESKVFD
jgi:hypothetical protein